MTPDLLTWGDTYALLGGEVRIEVSAAEEDLARLAAREAVEEIRRLEEVFSVYDPSTELSRWRAGDDAALSPELDHVLTMAARWHAASGGAFHPAAGAMRRRWLRAEAEGVLPTDAELAELVASCARLPYEADLRVRRVADCADVDLNAIARGYCVDAGLRAALGTPGVLAVTVDADGDLLRVGPGERRIPVGEGEVAVLREGALSSTSSGKRGFTVAGVRYGSVIDPRTGRPATGTPSATVHAPDALTADALATIVGVLPPDEALAWIDAREGVAALLVGPDGVVRRSARWDDYLGELDPLEAARR